MFYWWKIINLRMSYFHFSPLAPDWSKIVDSSVGNVSSFLKNNSSIFKLTVFFVKLSKGNPQSVQLSYGQLRLNSLHSFSIGVDDL